MKKVSYAVNIFEEEVKGMMME